MGIRSIERRLAPELCYEAVVEAVHEYLGKSRDAGRLLPPHEHLVVPIIRAGYYPPGLLGVGDFISRQEPSVRRAAEEGEITWVDEDSLIEEIMAPYPTARLRARRHREAKTRFFKAQAEQWRREDAIKCNTLQRNATDSASGPSGTEDGRAAEQTSRANGDDPGPLTAAVARDGNDNRPVPETGSVTDSHSEPAGQGGDAAKCNTVQQNTTISAGASGDTATASERKER